MAFKSDMPPGQALMLAALALPGLGVGLGVPDAAAQTLPDSATLSVDYLHYKDEQPGLDRVSVRSPAVRLSLPVAGAWLLEAGAVSDHVSGATPRYHTAISGASRMDDQRHAADLRVTRYLANASVSAGAAWSNENDYRSRALSLGGTISSADHNTTGGLSLGVSNDTISPVNLLVTGERRHTVELQASLEQVLTQRDIVKLDLTHAKGKGYYSDPYKYVDKRPRKRDVNGLLLRWNHALADGSAVRTSYRYYMDSFGIRAHTLGAEYERALGGGWALTPSLRLSTQSAADFYFDPVYDKRFGPPFPPGYTFGSTAFTSADQRLSGFGAVTAGLQAAYSFGDGWRAHVKAEHYRQSTGWRQFGSGSPGLARMDAQIWQLGVSKQW